MTQRVTIAGVDVAAITFDEALSLTLAAPAEGRRLRVHFCTVHTVVEANGSDRLRPILNAPDAVVMADGMPLVWVGRLRGARIERVCGPDFLPAVADRGRAHGYRHYFYGGGDGIADRLAATLAARYPGMIVAGVETPPFRRLTPEEDAAAVARINASGADFVWVGLGSPKQDLWLADHRDLLTAACLFAVGAAFDFHSGRLPRAPHWMQRSGTEWLFRLASEPRRLARRYAVTNTRFVVLVLGDAARGALARIRRRA